MSVVYDEKLLDKTGLAMVPSAYKGAADIDNNNGFLGKVYSVLPAQTLSENLLIDGQWFDQDGASEFSSNQIKINTGVNGSLNRIAQPNVVESGKIHTITYEVLQDTGIDKLQYYNGLSYIDLPKEIGIHTIQYTHQGSTLSFYIRVNDSVAGNYIVLSNNISLQVLSNGDFDFSRGSDATRVNSQGYIESVQVLSDELVQNGDFEELGDELIVNGDFEDGSNGWGTGAGNFDIIDGKAVVNHTNDSAVITQSNIATVGKIYRVEFTISNYSVGRIRLRYPFINDDLENNPRNGTFVYYGESIDHRFELQSRITEDANYEVDNISVKEVGQNWTFGTGWSIEDDGDNLRAVQSGGSTSSAYQNILTVGKLYQASFEITSITSGQFKIGIGENYSELYDEEGTYTYTAVATSDGLARIRPHTSTTVGTVDNFTVKEITDDTDIPRLDYSDGCPTLLLEPERTNSINHSEDFNEWSIGNVDVSSNEAVSPSGDLNAYELKPTQTTSTHLIAFSVTVTNVKTFSVFVKANGYTGFRLNTGSSANGFASFDLSNGTITNSGGTYYSDSNIEDYGNGWYRCSITFLANAPNNHTLAIEDNSGNVSFLGDGTSSIYVYGAQLEQGSYPTSYIPTNGEIVTRRADICNNAGDSTIFNDSEGVLFGEFVVDNVAAKTGLMSINDSSISNLLIVTINTNKQIQIEGTGSVNVLDTTVNTLGERIKIAFSYGQETAVFVNGKKTSIEADVFSGTGLNQAWLGSNPYGHLEGVKCNSFFYFPEVLSDAELEYITSSDIDVVLQNNKLKATMLGDTYEDGHVEDRLNELF